MNIERALWLPREEEERLLRQFVEFRTSPSQQEGAWTFEPPLHQRRPSKHEYQQVSRAGRLSTVMGAAAISGAGVVLLFSPFGPSFAHIS